MANTLVNKNSSMASRSAVDAKAKVKSSKSDTSTTTEIAPDNKSEKVEPKKFADLVNEKTEAPTKNVPEARPSERPKSSGENQTESLQSRAQGVSNKAKEPKQLHIRIQ